MSLGTKGKILQLIYVVFQSAIAGVFKGATFKVILFCFFFKFKMYFGSLL